MEWLLNNLERLSPTGLASAIDGLQLTKNRDVTFLFVYFLDDKRAVINFRAQHEAPFSYWDLRVCDIAYNAIGILEFMDRKLRESEGEKISERYHLYTHTTIEDRDKAIESLKLAWKKEIRSRFTETMKKNGTIDSSENLIKMIDAFMKNRKTLKSDAECIETNLKENSKEREPAGNVSSGRLTMP